MRLSIDEEVDTHSTDDSRTFLESRGLADLATFTVTVGPERSCQDAILT